MQIQHPYPCCSLGCKNGYASIFLAAPPDWFTDRNMSPPKNCPSCRSWLKQQIDSAYNCQTCGRIIRQSAKAKISHHKRSGPYQPPQQCKWCQNRQPRAGNTLRRAVNPNPILSPHQPVEREILPYAGLSSYRIRHYGEHIPGHPHSRVGQVKSNGQIVSYTTLVGPNASSEDLHRAGAAIAARTDEGISEFHNGG